MNNLLKEAEKLNICLKNSKEYQEYLYWKNNKDSNKEIQTLEEELKRCKETVCKNKDSQEDKKEYYQIEKELNSHPIMINYQEAKKLFLDKLSQIMNIINKGL